MDRGAWQATVPGVTKSQTHLKRQHSIAHTKYHISFLIFLLDSYSCYNRVPQLGGFKKKHRNLSCHSSGD